jgi:alpha-D-ribose 1-methylphosphonate 5-triphosphate synthase subunit PhnG
MTSEADGPLTPEELVELLTLARSLIKELEADRNDKAAHISRLETANTELATVNARLGTEVSALRDAHHDD